MRRDEIMGKNYFEKGMGVLDTKKEESNDYSVESVPITNIPNWVKNTPIPTFDPEDSYLEYFENGVICLLSDFQVNFTKPEIEKFFQCAYKITDNSCIGDMNNLSISFNPKKAQLLLHSVKILREEIVIDSLNPDKIQLFRQEKDLDRNLVTGDLTCYYTVPDLRVGDTLLYSYTIIHEPIKVSCGKGQSSILEQNIRSHYAPVLLDSTRLIWPKDIPFYETQKGDIPKVIKKEKDTIEICINVEKPDLNQHESDAPDFHLRGGRSYTISSEKNWRRIADYFAKRYVPEESPSQELLDFVRNISKSYPDPKDQIAEALDFCSSEVVYTSNSENLSENIPDRPSLVFARRYGDCKDKSLLLIEMLSLLGIKAYAALVDMEEREYLDAIGPYLKAFDHVVVYIELGEEVFWLDPTIKNQGKNLDSGFIFSDQKALILKSDTHSLIQVQSDFPSGPEIIIEEQFDFSDVENTLYKIETTYRYNHAQGVRNSYKESGNSRWKDSLLDYVQQYYPGATPIQDPILIDNYEKNTIKIDESYNLGNIFEKYENENEYAKVFFTEIDRFIKNQDTKIYKDKKRVLPMIFPQKEFVSCSQEFVFKGAKPDLPANSYIKNSAVKFQKEVKETQTGYKIDYVVETLTDRINPESFLSIIEENNSIVNETYDMLEKPINWYKKIFKFFLFLILFLLALWCRLNL